MSADGVRASVGQADMRQICIHDLRHSYSTLLLQAGAPIPYVSQQPGHRDAQPEVSYVMA